MRSSQIPPRIKLRLAERAKRPVAASQQHFDTVEPWNNKSTTQGIVIMLAGSRAEYPPKVAAAGWDRLRPSRGSTITSAPGRMVRISGLKSKHGLKELRRTTAIHLRLRPSTARWCAGDTLALDGSSTFAFRSEAASHESGQAGADGLFRSYVRTRRRAAPNQYFCSGATSSPPPR